MTETLRARCLDCYNRMQAGEGFAVIGSEINDLSVRELFRAIPMPSFPHAMLLDVTTDNILILRLKEGQNPIDVLGAASTQKKLTAFDNAVHRVKATA